MFWRDGRGFGAAKAACSWQKAMIVGQRAIARRYPVGVQFSLRPLTKRSRKRIAPILPRIQQSKLGQVIKGGAHEPSPFLLNIPFARATRSSLHAVEPQIGALPPFARYRRHSDSRKARSCKNAAGGP